MTKITICFVDNRTNCQNYVYEDAPNLHKYLTNNKFDADKYRNDYPHRIVKSVFNTEHSILLDKNEERYDFERQCQRFGFNANDYLSEFKVNNKTFVFIGFNTRNRKYVCRLYCKSNDTQRKATADFVKNSLKNDTEYD